MAHVRLTRLSLFAACIAITGCASTITAQTARPLPADDKLVFASAGAHYSSFCIECTHYNWIPHAEVGFRSGVNGRMDFGLELGTYGYLQSDLKLGLVRSERFDLAVAPALSLNTAFLQVWGLDVRPMLLAGVNLRRQPYEAGAVGLTFAAAPLGRLLWNRQPGSEAVLYAQLLGSATAWWQLTESFSLMLEASRLQTVALPQGIGPSEHFSLTQLALSVQYRFVAPADREIATR